MWYGKSATRTACTLGVARGRVHAKAAAAQAVCSVSYGHLAVHWVHYPCLIWEQPVEHLTLCELSHEWCGYAASVLALQVQVLQQRRLCLRLQQQAACWPQQYRRFAQPCMMAAQLQAATVTGMTEQMEYRNLKPVQ